MITAQIYCECCKSYDDTHDNAYVEKYNIEVCLFCFEEKHYIEQKDECLDCGLTIYFQHFNYNELQCESCEKE